MAKAAAAKPGVHKIEILKTDMHEDMLVDIRAISSTVFDKSTVHKDIATAIKQARLPFESMT